MVMTYTMPYALCPMRHTPSPQPPLASDGVLGIMEARLIKEETTRRPEIERTTSKTDGRVLM